jgi:hypothetical protein
MDSFATELYRSSQPLGDESGDLAKFCEILGLSFQEMEDLSRDGDSDPGWSGLVDIARCPEWALPWLAQCVGVQLVPGSTVAEKRIRIQATDGQKRGTPAAMVVAAQASLTGSKTVQMVERDGSAYALTVVTYTSETPDESAVLAALVSQKPAGIVLDYHTVDGQTWRQLEENYTDWQDVKDSYPDWRAVREDTPA